MSTIYSEVLLSPNGDSLTVVCRQLRSDDGYSRYHIDCYQVIGPKLAEATMTNLCDKLLPDSTRHHEAIREAIRTIDEAKFVSDKGTRE